VNGGRAPRPPRPARPRAWRGPPGSRRGRGACRAPRPRPRRQAHTPGRRARHGARDKAPRRAGRRASRRWRADGPCPSPGTPRPHPAGGFPGCREGGPSPTGAGPERCAGPGCRPTTAAPAQSPRLPEPRSSQPARQRAKPWGASGGPPSPTAPGRSRGSAVLVPARENQIPPGCPPPPAAARGRRHGCGSPGPPAAARHRRSRRYALMPTASGSWPARG
jgi:hypothetical protein